MNENSINQNAENRTTRKKDDISNGQNNINEYTHPNSNRKF